jgi:hypothetical protein
MLSVAMSIVSETFPPSKNQQDPATPQNEHALVEEEHALVEKEHAHFDFQQSEKRQVNALRVDEFSLQVDHQSNP